MKWYLPFSAETKQQVDDWAKEVEKAGGKLVSRPEAFGDGYYGFVFTDPDGHKFNVSSKCSLSSS